MAYVVKVEQKGTKTQPAASGYIADIRPVSKTKTGARFTLCEEKEKAYIWKSEKQLRIWGAVRLEKNSALSAFQIEELPE